MAWEVASTTEFDAWRQELTPAQQDAVDRKVGFIVQDGPALEFPHTSQVRGSRHGVMRELRVQSGGRPLRVFYAFDPLRRAILLIGGDKTGNDRFYQEYVRRADNLYDVHLETLRREGRIR